MRKRNLLIETTGEVDAAMLGEPRPPRLEFDGAHASSKDESEAGIRGLEFGIDSKHWTVQQVEEWLKD